MKKLIAFLFVSLLWTSNSLAAKGDGICGLTTNFHMDSNISIKVAAFVKVKDTDKDNCKKIIKVLSEAQKGNNKFEEHIKNIMIEAKFKSDVVVELSKLRLNWMKECGLATWGLEKFGDVCSVMEPYKLYLFANYDKNTVSKTLFDKNLDNDAAFEEVTNLLK